MVGGSSKDCHMVKAEQISINHFSIFITPAVSHSLHYLYNITRSYNTQNLRNWYLIMEQTIHHL